MRRPSLPGWGPHVGSRGRSPSSPDSSKKLHRAQISVPTKDFRNVVAGLPILYIIMQVQSRWEILGKILCGGRQLSKGHWTARRKTSGCSHFPGHAEY